MKLSVVIPTRNRARDVKALLGALAGQTRRPDEVLVVDSSDRPIGVDDYSPPPGAPPLAIKYFHTARGACRQRNLGARRSSGDIVFFIDDDVLPAPDFIEEMEHTFLDHPEYHGGMGTVTPVMMPWSPGSILCRLFMLQHEHGDGGFYPSGMPRHPYGTAHLRDTMVMGGGLTAVRRSVFVEDGIEFDERMVLSHQDTDYSRRLSRRRRLFYNPRARVEHRLSPIERPDAYEQGRRYMFNFRYMYLKNFYPDAPWTLPAHWWSLVGMFLVAGLTGPLARLRGYWDGFQEFGRMRGGLSPGIFE